MDRTFFTVLLVVILIQSKDISTTLAESSEQVPDIQITVNRAIDNERYLTPHIEIQGLALHEQYQIVADTLLVRQSQTDCFRKRDYFTANVTGRSNSSSCWKRLPHSTNPGRLNVTVDENIHLQLERSAFGSVIQTKLLYCIKPNHTLMINDKLAEKQLYRWRINKLGKKWILAEVKGLNSDWRVIRNCTNGSDQIILTCQKIGFSSAQTTYSITDSPNKGDKSKPGIIAGVVSAGIVLIIVLGVVFFVVFKKKTSVKEPRTVRATRNDIDCSSSLYEARPVDDEDYNILHQNIRRPVNAEIYEENYNLVPPITTKLNSEQRSGTYCMVELPVCKNTAPYSDPAQENTTLLSTGDHHYSHGNDVYTQVNKGENQQFNPRASQEIPEPVTMVANAIYEDGQPDAENDDVVYSLADDL